MPPQGDFLTSCIHAAMCLPEILTVCECYPSTYLVSNLLIESR